MEESKRLKAAIWLVRVINSCRTPQQAAVARKLVERFQAMYDRETPLMRYLLNIEFEINALNPR